jgi:hypothetical protein
LSAPTRSPADLLILVKLPIERINKTLAMVTFGERLLSSEDEPYLKDPINQMKSQ